MATNDGHGENSPYFDGWKAYDSNPFHPTQNPHGVIQMGLAENKAVAKFMGRVGGNKFTFDAKPHSDERRSPGANETLMFCLADPGDAFLVPSPYYAGLSKDMGIPGFVSVSYTLSMTKFMHCARKAPRGCQKAPCFRQGAGTCWDFLLEKHAGLFFCETQCFSGFIFPLLRPGWFRVCFANMDDETFEVALGRIQAFVLGQEKQEPDKSKHWRKKHLLLSFSSSRLYDETIMSAHILSPHSPLVRATT
ncbi:Heavy metal transport/detoxification superfamily protein [Hibiscus syriacus]|uniref:Heavy metal transport/detoxification superfamily protein n=1 Tax=Hibiscus syriacus TaxID=106335 RepID=A0A6A2WHS5_HIBSY|nr:Heavy metal transport/detoxification superfamily protein [Hibiscus syriacus]